MKNTCNFCGEKDCRHRPHSRKSPLWMHPVYLSEDGTVTLKKTDLQIGLVAHGQGGENGNRPRKDCINVMTESGTIALNIG